MHNEDVICNYKQSKPAIYTGFLSGDEVCYIFWGWFIYLIVPLSPRAFLAIAFILKWQFFTFSIIPLFRQEFFRGGLGRACFAALPRAVWRSGTCSQTWEPSLI